MTFDTPPTSVSEFQVTGETRVVANKDTNQSVTSGTWATIDWDNESIDNRDEHNLTTNEFTPDKSGDYWIFVSLNVSGTSGDSVRIRFIDTDDFSENFQKSFILHSSSGYTIAYNQPLDLTGGVTYEVQVRDDTSSLTVQGLTDRTRCVYKRVVEQ